MTFPQNTLLPGVITILLTVFAMALTDAFVKYASSNMTLWQIYVCRSALALPLLAMLAKGRILPNALGWVSLRSLLLVAMYLAIYAAIPVLDLSVIAATLYTAPVFIVLLTALFLKERVKALQYCAIGLGFVGVLCVVQPRSAEFTPLSLIPVIAAFLYALAAVLTRAKCVDEAPAALAINLNAALILVGGLVSALLHLVPLQNAADYPFLLGTWSELNLETLGVLVLMAVLIIGVTRGLARAYQSPRPHIIATFDYAYLIFAAFWGFVFFGEVPNGSTLFGIGLIMIAGVFVLRADATQGP